MRRHSRVPAELGPDRLLAAYASGIFPMADEEERLHWLAPDPRAILELDRFRASRSLRAVIRRGSFATSVNRAFVGVIDACADREQGTWISRAIREAYCKLHALGFAHSVEAWQGGQLAGGLYGVAIGGAFFGESMFHRKTDASKVALEYLIQRLRSCGFRLLDIQFMTEHLRQFGAEEIPRAEYVRRLREAVGLACVFDEAVGPTAIRWPKD